MLRIIIVLFFFFLFGENSSSVYTISIPVNDTANIDLSAYQGKKIFFVNTASNSPYVSQYNQLEDLYQKYKDSLVIIALPSNSFGNEPEGDSTIAAFVNTNFRISYLLAAKGDVTGGSTAPIYSWLEREDDNGVMNSSVKDDFQKYLVDGSGNLVGVFDPTVQPLDSMITDAIEGK